MPVALMILRDHSASGHVQCCKERRGAVAYIVPSASFDLAGAQRQQGLTAVEGLDLRLLVDTEYQGLPGRVEIQPDDVAHLLDELRVTTSFEGLDAMGFELEGSPDALYRHVTQTQRTSHGACCPVCSVRRWSEQSGVNHLLDLPWGERRDPARSWAVPQTLQTALSKLASPM